MESELNNDDNNLFVEFTISILLLFDYYVCENETWVMNETFEEDIVEIIQETICESGIDVPNQLVYELLTTFAFGINKLYPFRSYQTSFVTEKTLLELEMIDTALKILNNVVQHEQRSDEWYEYRHNLITASNAYKMFGSQSLQNSLIYEKCQPIKCFSNQVSETSPLHHGQKYEPVSIALYEKIYDTKVSEFGCNQHPVYKFLGASPDGINTDKESSRYGRMLEIKNVVSRNITGMPKKEYWIQMQLQMETCDLMETDFLETKFVEYLDENAFMQDNPKSIQFTQDNNYKGIMLQYVHKHLIPDENSIVDTFGYTFSYSYMPLQMDNYENFLMWREEDTQRMEQEGKGYVRYARTIYWKLEKLSCVLVLRNIQWFESNIQTMSKFWDIIKKEKIDGYEHRAPKARSSIRLPPMLSSIIF